MSRSDRVSRVSIRRVGAPRRVSDELVHACAGFGVLPTAARGRTPARVPEALTRAIRPGRVVLLAGASGAGKSTVMRALACSLAGRRVVRVSDRFSEVESERAVFDCLGGDPGRRTGVLALAGLAEPTLWARASGALSEGEGARLRLAMAMARAEPGSVVLADEFASTLDRVTAYALARTVRRWARRERVAFVAASAHEDLEAYLAPDAVVDAASGMSRPAREARGQLVRVEGGTMDDYRRLAHLHYRTGAPASVVRVLRGVREVPRHIDPAGELLAGVLCVSMPTLNGAWRDRAWAGFFSTGDKRRDARRLNTHLRTISRVIVDPRSRGMGVATALVRSYLRDPITRGTESRAAMGCVCPFFERAGMAGYDLPPDLTDTRLLDALGHMGIAPAQLAGTRLLAGSLLARELTTWGKRRKLLPAGCNSLDEVQRLTPTAACRLCSRPRAYAYTKGEWVDEEHDT